MPMLRAVPSMTFMPASMSLALRSGILISAIWRTWSRVTRDQVRQIAETKMVDLNVNDIEAGMKVIEGTARSMGIEVVG